MSKALTRLGASGFLCCALLAVLALPASASARRIFDIKHPGLAVKIPLRGTHGYRIEIENSRGKVRLKARKGDLVAEYEVPGQVTRRGIHANFGGLGRISVRFRRIGRPEVGGPPISIFDCKGRNPIHEHGSFVGTIRFHGELGYTDVSVNGARGSVVRKFKRRCSLPHRPPAAGTTSREGPDQGGLRVLAAVERSHGRTVLFESVDIEGLGEEGLTLVVGGTAEHRGRVWIRRATLIEGDAGTVLASPPGTEPITATVSLPSPFAGSASYLEAAGTTPSWTGPLAVRLPGTASVPLTGPGFTAALCQAKGEKRVESCLGDVMKALGDPDTFMGLF